MGWTLVTGIHQTCRDFTAEQNALTNERAAAILAILLIVFSAWQLWIWFELARCWCGQGTAWPAWWRKRSWGCGLAADSVSLSILNAGLGAAVASTICFTQVQTVASQAAALAAFSHAMLWLFTETIGELLGQLFTLVPFILANVTLWSMANQWEWQGNHDPRWYLLTGCVVMGISISTWITTYNYRAHTLTNYQIYTAHVGAAPRNYNSRMPNFVWVDGTAAIKLQRARIICETAHGPVRAYRRQVIAIAICTAAGAMVTAIRAAISTKDAFEFSLGPDGRAELAAGISHTWYLMAGVASCVANFFMVISAVFTGAIVLRVAL